MANSVDPDQTEGAVWSGSTLFAYAILSLFAYAILSDLLVYEILSLCWGFTALSTQWNHVEHGQFT